MTGVILETLNYKKLLAFAILLLLSQISFFLIGGLIAPSPNTSDQILTTKCVDRHRAKDEWFFVRPVSSNYSCKEILPDGDLTEVVPQGVTADQIVFMAQFPLPREGLELHMTKWFQQLIAVLMLDIKYKSKFQVADNAEMVFDVRLGYRNKGDADNDWKELARSREVRPLDCKLDPEAKRHLEHGHSLDDGYYYDCEVLPLFTLGSVYYDHYLVNLRIPIEPVNNVNTHIGMLQDLWLVEIHQNGGFTKVWFALKTFVFPLTLAALIFFWYRVKGLNRPITILERTILALGIVLSILNFPIEWLSLSLNVSFWLVLSDIRQGAFYATLVCFWLVFTGEHMMNDSSSQSDDNSFLAKIGLNGKYWPKLILVAGCCVSLCIFELAERGVQLHNPFYSIWSHPVAAKMGYASMIVGALCASVYFCYLAYLVVSAFISMVGKRQLLSKLPENRRRYYSGVIYRFSILLFYTILCAAVTVVFYIFSQVNEDQWKWGNQSIEYTSAFITGVYGMWNIYVIAVLCLYAPSNKFKSSSGQDLLNQLIINSADSQAPTGEAVDLQVYSTNSGAVVAPVSDGFRFVQKAGFE